MNRQNARAVRTKQRILTSSEILFSKQGFKNSTLRQITALSSSNLAAVHYHFGSKEGLMTNIMDRIFADFASIFKEQYLHQARQSSIGISEILEIIIDSLIALNKRNAQACLLLYRFHELYGQNKDNFVTLLLKKYEDNINNIKNDIKIALSMLSEDEINIRISFMLHSLLPLLLIIGQNNDNRVTNSEEIKHPALKFLPIISAGILYNTRRE